MNCRRQPKNVVVVLWLAGSAGRKQLTGILNFIKNGHPWSLRIIAEPREFTAEVLQQTEMNGIDGLIIHAGEQTAQALSNLKTPTVLIDFPPPSLTLRKKHFAILLDSDEDIGKCGANYFLNLGNFSSYGFIPDLENRGWSRLRERGFKKTLRAFDRNCIVLNESRTSMDAYLLSLPKPAAIMAAYDFKAKEALDACNRLKLKVPQQVAVLGVDNDEIVCEYSKPSLSSIKIDHEAFGYESAKILAKMMDSKRACRDMRLFMPAGSVIERESTAPTASSAHLVQKAMEYIRSHLVDDICVNDVVQHLGNVSRRLIDRRFRELTGNSIRKTIEDLRLEKVKKNLSSTNMPIEKISKLSGYANTQRLKYVFKSRFGVSMSEWRKSNRTDPHSVADANAASISASGKEVFR